MTDECLAPMLVARLYMRLPARVEGAVQAMLPRCCGRAARSMLMCFRELFLILAVGVLGSQILIAFNGGAPIGVEAQAATRVVDRSLVLISSVHFDFDPGNPTFLRSVNLQVTTPDGVQPENLNVAPTPASLESYPCHVEWNDSWHCPTPGLKLAELERVVLSGS